MMALPAKETAAFEASVGHAAAHFAHESRRHIRELLDYIMRDASAMARHICTLRPPNGITSAELSDLINNVIAKKDESFHALIKVTGTFEVQSGPEDRRGHPARIIWQLAKQLSRFLRIRAN
jgi:hypothetical protein